MNNQVLPMRVIYLEDIPFVGWADGPNVFHVAWEFWLQCGPLAKTHKGVLPECQAVDLAKDLERPLDRSWAMQLYLWTDDDGSRARELAAFLRQGCCAVRNGTSMNPVAKEGTRKPKSKSL